MAFLGSKLLQNTLFFSNFLPSIFNILMDYNFLFFQSLKIKTIYQVLVVNPLVYVCQG